MDVRRCGRLVQPQPVEYGGVQGLCTALCGRYRSVRPVCMGHSRRGRPLPALVLTPYGVQKPARRVLYVAAFCEAERDAALLPLALCEDVCRALNAGLPLCGVPIERALTGRQLWFVPLASPDGTDITFHFTAGCGEMQALQEKKVKNRKREALSPFPPEVTALTSLCRGVGFHHVIALTGTAVTVGATDALPHSAMMARVLGAAGGGTVTPLPRDSFAAWLTCSEGCPAFAVGLGEGDFSARYRRLQELLVLAALL